MRRKLGLYLLHIKKTVINGSTLLNYCPAGICSFHEEAQRKQKRRSDNQIKNFFYCRLRKIIRKLNKVFKEDENYRSNFIDFFFLDIIQLLLPKIELHLNESILFKLMKKLDITLGDVYAMPYREIGDQLLQSRRKKKPTKKPQPSNAEPEVKKLIVSLPMPKPAPTPVATPSPIAAPTPHPEIKLTPLTTPKPQIPFQQQFSPASHKPEAPQVVHEITSWNTSGSPFRNPSPYRGSPFARQAFFVPSTAGSDIPLMSSPNLTAFTPYRAAYAHPSPGFIAFQGNFFI